MLGGPFVLGYCGNVSLSMSAAGVLALEPSREAMA